ncbi:TIGR00180 family glycosyltransferase [Candidatus Babeliales bacterium]|nr:TIGR00180 family glycosyltransferase [Candidatus Babeliales bacterium]
MNNSRLKDVTMILITHDRSHFLARSLAYYSEMNAACKIIIADSSGSKHAAENKVLVEKFNSCGLDIEYRHLEDANKEVDALAHFLSCAIKVVDAANLVTTPYTLLAPDDDFFILDAIEKSIQFLDENVDYVCCQGRQIEFFLKRRLANNDFIWKPLLPFRLPEARSDDPVERLHYMLERYKDAYYAVYRTNAFRRIFGEIQRCPLDVIFVEALHRALAGILGKTKVLDVLYFIRQSASDSNSMGFDHSQLLYKNLFQKMCLVHEVIGRWLCEYGGVERERAETLAHFYTNRFVNWKPDWAVVPPVAVPISRFKSYIKHLLPAKSIAWINQRRSWIRERYEKKIQRKLLVKQYSKLLGMYPIQFMKIRELVIKSDIVVPINTDRWKEL